MKAQTEEKTVEQLKTELDEVMRCLGALSGLVSGYIRSSEFVVEKGLQWPNNKIDPIGVRSLDAAIALNRKAIYIVKDYCGIDFW